MSPNVGPPNGILVAPNKTLRIREKKISIEMGCSVTLYRMVLQRLIRLTFAQYSRNVSIFGTPAHFKVATLSYKSVAI